MARITSPTGEQMPDTDNPGLLAYYERRGYTVDHDGGELKPFDEMTVDELRGYAREHDISLGGASKKADIIAAIAGVQPDGTATTAGDTTPTDDGTPTEPNPAD